MLHKDCCVRRGVLVILGLAVFALVPAMLPAQNLRQQIFHFPPRSVSIPVFGTTSIVNCDPDPKTGKFTMFCVQESGPFKPGIPPPPPVPPVDQPVVLPQFGFNGGTSGGFQGNFNGGLGGNFQGGLGGLGGSFGGGLGGLGGGLGGLGGGLGGLGGGLGGLGGGLGGIGGGIGGGIKGVGVGNGGYGI